MPKTIEEINQLKEEIEILNKKLLELTDDELQQVTGGSPLFLVATHLTTNVYNRMFENCKPLETMSNLPKTSKIE